MHSFDVAVRIELPPRTLSHTESDANNRCVARSPYVTDSDLENLSSCELKELTVQLRLPEREYAKGASDAYLGVTKIVLVGEIAWVDRNPDLRSAGR